MSFASLVIAAGIAYVLIVLLRFLTGRPNNWSELGLWFWCLSVSPIACCFVLNVPGAFGLYASPNRTEPQLRRARRQLWIKALVKTGVLLVVFLAWRRPDMASKLAAIVTWLFWIALVLRPLIPLMAMVAWREWRPECSASE